MASYLSGVEFEEVRGVARELNLKNPNPPGPPKRPPETRVVVPITTDRVRGRMRLALDLS